MNFTQSLKEFSYFQWSKLEFSENILQYIHLTLLNILHGLEGGRLADAKPASLTSCLEDTLNNFAFHYRLGV